MHHNISDSTKRRLDLGLMLQPAHRNRRRRGHRRFEENTVLGCLLALAIIIGIAAIFATA